MISVALFPDLDGYWFSVSDADPRAVALYSRHYSVKNKRPNWSCGIGGPGERTVLLTATGDALFVWRSRIGGPAKGETQYDDGQRGVMCSVFRNESPIRSSDLIREAMDIAWRRWPGARLFTYVWDDKVKSANPGYCFKRAGWRTCGRNADGRLTILEVLPPPTELDVRESAACRSGVLVAGPTRRAQAAPRTTTAPWLGVVAAAPAAGRTYPPAGGTHRETPPSGN